MLFPIIYLISILSLITCQHTSHCTSPTLRKEIRELTPNELTTFISAINTLKRTGIYDTFSQIHYSNNLYSHGVPAFLPWHREFLYLFEKELQKVNPNIILPYWDWSLDSQSPELSSIFDLFGGNGNHQLNGDNCISNGPFKGWNCSVPQFHCLRRDFDLNDKISAFYSPEAIELLLRDSLNYNDFRLALEALPHAKVHSGIGGKNGDIMTMFSSNDPLFFLHHVFIDQLWFEWQLRFENHKQFVRYNGEMEGIKVNENDTLIPFNVNVKYTLKTMEGKYCYKYKRYEVELPEIESRLKDTKRLNKRLSKRLGKRLLGLDGIVDTVLKGVENTINVNLIGQTTGLLSQLINNINVNQIISVNPEDRNQRFKIRRVNPIDKEFLIKNRLPIERVRKLENQLNLVTAYYNSLNGFLPKAKLLN